MDPVSAQSTARLARRRSLLDVANDNVLEARNSGIPNASEGDSIGSQTSPAWMKKYMPQQKEAGPQPTSVSVQDSINMDVLKVMKRNFMSADADGSGELGPDEFIKAFYGILSTDDGGDKEALEKLFMRIDADCNGTVDWDEFCTYMLMENQGSASIRDNEISMMFDKPETGEESTNVHRDLVTSISIASTGLGADRYVTTARDGTIKIWNAKYLTHMRTINCGSAHLTGGVYLPLTGKFAAASFARSLKIYDLNTYEQCGIVPDIEHAPVSLDVWVPPTKKDTELVAFGDVGGFVRLYELRLYSMDKKSEDRYSNACRWRMQLHKDWVSKVRFVADLNAVLAASLDSTLTLNDVELRVPLKRLEGHTKGVHCCDWSAMYKFVCSGSQDRTIMLWNPFSQKPLATLTGHSAAVTDVRVNERDNQIISVSNDKTVKVWDIRNHKCLQTVLDKEEYKLENTVGVMTFDPARRCLVSANVRPKRWPLKSTGTRGLAHHHPITAILHNPIFNEAVSADTGGTICVWHVPTGKLRFRFSNAHGEHPVTAICFDTERRRLVTGSANGEVKVWNFSSGACLKVLHNRTHEEITAVHCTRSAIQRQILSCGWDRRVTFWGDGDEREAWPQRSIQGHKSDVLSMALMEGVPLLVTSTYDGDICLWNADSGVLKKKLHAPCRDRRPENERAVEKIMFLRGRHRHVLLAVGADRYLRMWDTATGSCLAERFTGHVVGETVCALAVDSRGMRVATGDSAGFVKTWDISAFDGRAIPSSQLENTIAPIIIWRGHHKGVTCVEFVDPPAALPHNVRTSTSGTSPPLSPGGRRYTKDVGNLEDSRSSLLMTTSSDHKVTLWTIDGARVGTFGHDPQWSITDQFTWKSPSAEAMEERDAFLLTTSSEPLDYRKVINEYPSLATASALLRPSTAPASVRQVCEASWATRAERIRHLAEEEPGTVEEWRTLSGDESSSGSCSSSDADSDVQVPRGLWLDSFTEARKQTGSLTSSAAIRHSHSRFERSLRQAPGVARLSAYGGPSVQPVVPTLQGARSGRLSVSSIMSVLEGPRSARSAKGGVEGGGGGLLASRGLLRPGTSPAGGRH